MDSTNNNQLRGGSEYHPTHLQFVVFVSQYKDFVNEHGPKAPIPKGPLKNWQRRIRQKFTDEYEGRPLNLTKTQVQQLANVGFVTHVKNRSKESEAFRFMWRFAETFRKQNGHMNFHQEYAKLKVTEDGNGTEEVDVVDRLREHYQVIGALYLKKKMGKDRREQLEDLGVDMTPFETREASSEDDTVPSDTSEEEEEDAMNTADKADDVLDATNEVVNATSEDDDDVMNTTDKADDVLDATNQVVKKKRKQKIDGLKEPLLRRSKRKMQKNLKAI